MVLVTAILDVKPGNSTPPKFDTSSLTLYHTCHCDLALIKPVEKRGYPCVK